MFLHLLPQELVGVLLLSASLNLRSVSATPSVNVALQASFAAPPYLLELLETAAEENSTAYFPLLDRIAEGRFADCSTDQELYHDFLKVLRDDGHISSEDSLSSFQFALSIHSAAPRIAAHYHFYDSSIEPSLMVAQDAACPVWVHFDGKQYCSPALDRAQQDAGPVKPLEGLPFDRILEVSTDSGLTPSILYADITSPLFGQFHQVVSNTARNGETSYRVRYRPQAAEQTKPLAVNGYGVELTLKRTDYIVIDDREAGNEGETEADASEDGSSAEVLGSTPSDTLDEDVSDLKPLTSKSLSGLGIKAAGFIMGTGDPFETLVKVSQDFPKYSSIISKRNISRELLIEHRTNRETFLPAGYNVILMNGQQVQSREMDAFALLEQLRRERSIVGNLRSLGLNGAEAVKVLSSPAIAESKAGGEPQRYDYRDSLEGGRVIIWLNDIEKDGRYSTWPDQASALLQRTWPGQLPQVRKDIHNAVIPVDLVNVQDLEMIVETLQTVVKRKVPIRFGIVPVVDSPSRETQAKVVYHLWDTYGLSAVFAYLEMCIGDGATVSAHRGHFESTISDRKLRSGRQIMEFDAVVHVAESGDQRTEDAADFGNEIRKPRSMQATRDYLRRLGADAMPAPLFANGAAMPRNDAWLQTMSSRIDADLRTLQRQLFEGILPEDTWLAGHFIEHAHTHRNALIVPEDESTIQIVNLGKIMADWRQVYDELPHIPSLSSKVGLERFAPDLVVVADLDTKEGATLLLEAVRFQQGNEEVRLSIIHSPIGQETPAKSVAIFLKAYAGSNVDVKDIEAVLNEAVESETFPKHDVEEAKRFWQNSQSLLKALGLAPGQQAVLLNGRMAGPFSSSTEFAAADFNSLLQFERAKRLKPAEQALSALGLHDRITSPLDAAIISSTIALSTISDIPEGIFDSAPILRIDKFENWEGRHTLIQTGDPESSSIHLVASIDPTSQVAQRWIPILKVLSELSGVHLRLYLNPLEKMQELPIKRFYRYILNTIPSFTDSGAVKGLAAEFHGVPKEALLNLALDVPPAWLVAPKASIHDLDNIKLSALKEGTNVDALYELESILIEGHSRDVTVGPPPRGVQLLLGTEKDPHFADTIIMANLGYFQFKANPGFWNLKLQPGRSSQIFTIDSAGQKGYNPVAGDESTDITLMSFQGKTLYPRLSRKPGQEAEDVLEEGGSSVFKSGTPGSYLNKVSKLASSFLSKAGLAPSAPKHADINIFSVASGHLYERMLSIMMVSVMRHTTHTVKFWFIEQFLSPSFKASLPTLASHYGFQYSLVTYKWPHWLRAQSEKQREIWGYKILFLDVLFPISLDKVIFVDADQIVRTDMYELIQLDLEGAPYGFTPMCDSRTEMEGFRFWKTGYWANFLRGLPYHISALYVVDLVKFREIAAGDRLRGQYHQLSADPASLSNLDQDLPNHMQHVLPIKSLPQEWLWCETWCSDEALETAKTIDLCNNPQTKEPKLKRARRQVPEWTVYDEEIAGVLAAAKGTGSEVRGGVQEVMVEGTASVPSAGGEDARKTSVLESVGEQRTEVKDEL